MADLTVTLGADIGNSAIKVKPDTGESFVIPTMIDKVAMINTFAESKDPLKQLDLTVLESKCAPTGRAFYGHLASETGNGKPMPVRARKADSAEVFMSMILAMAVTACRRIDAMKRQGKAIVDKAQLENRPVEVEVNLGTGLPLGEFQDDAVKKAFRKAIKGVHRVRFDTTPVWKDYGEIKLVVQNLEVSSEGMAVLYDLVFDAAGTLVDEKLAEGNVLINDIGSGTHDQPYYEAMDLRNALSKPYDSKVNENMDAITEKVNHLYTRNLTRYDVERFIFTYDHAIPNGNQDPISIKHITEPRFRSVASLVATRTKQAFEDSKGMMTHVVMAGGGSAVVKEYLEPELERIGLPTPFPFKILWMANGQMANACGYYKMINERLLAKASRLATGD